MRDLDRLNPLNALAAADGQSQPEIQLATPGGFWLSECGSAVEQILAGEWAPGFKNRQTLLSWRRFWRGNCILDQ